LHPATRQGTERTARGLRNISESSPGAFHNHHKTPGLGALAPRVGSPQHRWIVCRVRLNPGTVSAACSADARGPCPPTQPERGSRTPTMPRVTRLQTIHGLGGNPSRILCSRTRASSKFSALPGRFRALSLPPWRLRGQDRERLWEDEGKQSARVAEYSPRLAGIFPWKRRFSYKFERGCVNLATTSSFTRARPHVTHCSTS